jgi:hypothetical protein
MRLFLALFLATLSTATHAALWDVGAQAAHYSADTEVFGESLNANGTLYGVSLSGRTEDGPGFLGLDLRGLVGDVEHDLAGDDKSALPIVAEGRVLAGYELFLGTTFYTGLGFRYLDVEMPFDGQRTSSNAYVPLGITKTNQVTQSKWAIRTELEVAYVPLGQEDLEATVGGSDLQETFSRDSGWVTRLAINFRNDTWFIEPFIRYWNLHKTDTETVAGGDYFVKQVEETEFGLRTGLAF